jgi:hypothetical protein
MTETNSSNAAGRWCNSSFLLKPLSWVSDRLGNAIKTEPTLIEPLIEVDQGRMHLIALAIAHLTSDVTPNLAHVLLRGSKTAILDLSIGHHPTGLDRALAHLPANIMAADSYRYLVGLLNDSVTAKFLHHRACINELTLRSLQSLPADLRRPAVMTMINRIDGMERFVDGLRFLASLARLPFDLLASQIASLDQPEQIVAKIRQLVENLPLPDLVLPATIGEFRRVDSIAEIRALAKNWQNCLADYLYNINEGTSAIYLSENLEVVCFLSRHGRIGWFLLQAKGPRNVDIAPDRLVQIHSVFADAGFPEGSVIEAIKSILLTDEWSHHRQAEDQDEFFHDIALD